MNGRWGSWFRLTTLVIALTWLAGCTLLPPPRAREVFVHPGTRPELSMKRLQLHELTVEAGAASSRVRDDAMYIYGLLLGRINADRESAGQEAPLSIAVSVSEAPFVSGFETKNAVSIETRVFDGSDEYTDRTIALALFSEETESTIVSYRYLFDVIEASLAEIFR